jgi:hypothetical protein
MSQDFRKKQPRKQRDTDVRSKTGTEVYAEWYRGLSKDERDELLSKGLGPEDSEGRIDSNYIFEIHPENQAFGFTETHDFDDPLPKPKRVYDQDEVESIIRRVVMAMQLSEMPEVLFQARCILIAFGIGDPPTETELARIKGCSRQFVSKKVKRIQQLFNLSPSQFMRSEQACKAYADAWKKNQTKNNKINLFDDISKESLDKEDDDSTQ